jgi:transposase
MGTSLHSGKKVTAVENWKPELELCDEWARLACREQRYDRYQQVMKLYEQGLGVERDKAPVVTGLTLPQNNGLLEGKVNKLKLIKRMRYGRAGFVLLRQRALHAL